MSNIETSINPLNLKAVKDIIPDSIAQLSFLTGFQNTIMEVIIQNRVQNYKVIKTTDSGGKFTIQSIASGNTPADLPAALFNRYSGMYFMKLFVDGVPIVFGASQLEGIRFSFSSVFGFDSEFIMDLGLGDDTVSLVASAWLIITSGPVQIYAGKGYAINSTNKIALALPLTAKVNDLIWIRGQGTGGFQITQAADQQIQFGSLTTTSGITGNIDSSSQGDVICLQYIGSNTWMVVSSIGTFTVDGTPITGRYFDQYFGPEFG